MLASISIEFRLKTSPSTLGARRGELFYVPAFCLIVLGQGGTSNTREFRSSPVISLHQTPLPVETRTRILGVIFDTLFTFSPHIDHLISRALPRLNILRALAGTGWGQQKETIIITYKSIIRSLFTYSCPIWFPNTAPSNIRKLLTIQNSALRTATGCVKMSSIDHLHAETQVLPVVNHLSLLCSQYLARTLQPNHPSHHITSSDSGPRRIKQTLQSKFLPSVSPFLSNRTLPPEEYEPTVQSLHTNAVSTGPRNTVWTLREDTLPHIQHLLQPNGLASPSVHRRTLKAIHTEEVSSYVNSRPPNKVLNTLPPVIPAMTFPHHHVQAEIQLLLQTTIV